jgi:hypothetical protein
MAGVTLGSIPAALSLAAIPSFINLLHDSGASAKLTTDVGSLPWQAILLIVAGVVTVGGWVLRLLSCKLCTDSTGSGGDASGGGDTGGDSGSDVEDVLLVPPIYNYTAPAVKEPVYKPLYAAPVASETAPKPCACYQLVFRDNDLDVSGELTRETVTEALDKAGIDARQGTLHLRFDAPRLRRIGEGAFSGFTGLKGELIIPDSVEDIGAGAFARCDFDKVILPATLSKLKNIF